MRVWVAVALGDGVALVVGLMVALVVGPVLWWGDGEADEEACLVCPSLASGDPPVQPLATSAHSTSAAGSGWRERMSSPGSMVQWN
jgi:hypothetical protein